MSTNTQTTTKNNPAEFDQQSLSYEELLKIEGLSTTALKAKQNEGKFSIFQRNPRVCPLSAVDINDITYQNVELIKKFITEMGRIIPSRLSFVDKTKQKKLTQAIKIARTLGLIPFVNK